MKRIHLISGPRNLSTALMYSFGNREDCSIVDEPFYACYLQKFNVDHPGKDEILASMSSDVNEVLEKTIFSDFENPILFIKNMAQHFRSLDYSFLLNLSNIFLIRDPKALIVSFSKVIRSPVMEDIGLQLEWELFDYLMQCGKRCIVIDSGELVKDPKKILSDLCFRLSIDFSNKMLSWDAGPRKEDGVWAKYWYENVHQSTHFSNKKITERELPAELYSLYYKAKEYYDKLFNHALIA